MHDILLIAIFFLSYQCYGLYVATAATILSAWLLLCWTLLVQKKKPSLTTQISVGTLTLLGGSTLVFQNPAFIQWKTSIVYWTIALIFFITPLIKPYTLIEKMMSAALENKITDSPVSALFWKNLNWAWVIFSLLMGLLNWWVFTHYELDIWVSFKLYGIIGLTAAFVMGQTFFFLKLKKQPSHS